MIKTHQDPRWLGAVYTPPTKRPFFCHPQQKVWPLGRSPDSRVIIFFTLPRKIQWACGALKKDSASTVTGIVTIDSKALRRVPFSGPHAGHLSTAYHRPFFGKVKDEIILILATPQGHGGHIPQGVSSKNRGGSRPQKTG